MSAAPAAEAAPAAPPAGNKKLIIILAAALVLVLVGSGVGFFLMSKKKPAEGEEGEGGESKAKAKAEAPAEMAKSTYDPKKPPAFAALEPFTVNLADQGAERFAQVAITLELDDAKTADLIKTFMPAIRNNILLVIADRTAADLMSRDGKARLAERMRRAAARGLGYAVDDLEDEEDEEASDAPKKKKKKKKAVEVALPIRAVHFTNIIIQ